MTISAEHAMAIANAACQQEGWGDLPTEKYEAFMLDFDGKPAWEISRNEIVAGFQVRFVIDAETGTVIQKKRLGFR